MKEENKGVVVWFLFIIYILGIIFISRCSPVTKDIGIYTDYFYHIFFGVLWTATIYGIGNLIFEED